MELGEDGGGEVVEVGALPLEDEGGLGEGGGSGGAGTAGVLTSFSGGVGLDAATEEDLLGLGFNLDGGVGGDGAAEVFDGEEQASGVAVVGGDDGDADGGEVGVKNVGAVDGAVHPGIVDLGGGGAVAGDVLGDGAEAGPGVGGAGEEVGFAGVLVLGDASGTSGEGGVKAGGSGEGWVPGERCEVVLGAGLVGELEEGLLGWGLCVRLGNG